MSELVITDEIRARRKARLEEMLDRVGYAYPSTSGHVKVRELEFQILEEMEKAGRVTRDKRRVDKDGFPNERGRSFQTIWRPAK